MAIIDPTIEKILGLVRDQVKGVYQRLGKPPKVRTAPSGYIYFRSRKHW
jgi:hypothetical protein